MNRTRRLAVCIAFCTAAALFGADDPYIGTWKVDMAASKYGDVEKPWYTDQVATFEPGEKMTIKTTENDGKVVVVSFAAALGKAVEVTGMEDCTVVRTRPEVRVLQHVWTCKGKEIARDRATVAQDGRSLELVSWGNNAKGQDWKWVETFRKQ